MLDIERLLSELTVAEKASLTSGSSFWYTAPVERLGIPTIMVSDGPTACGPNRGRVTISGSVGPFRRPVSRPHQRSPRPGIPTCSAGSVRRWPRKPGPRTCR